MTYIAFLLIVIRHVRIQNNGTVSPRERVFEAMVQVNQTPSDDCVVIKSNNK